MKTPVKRFIYNKLDCSLRTCWTPSSNREGCPRVGELPRLSHRTETLSASDSQPTDHAASIARNRA